MIESEVSQKQKIEKSFMDGLKFVYSSKMCSKNMFEFFCSTACGLGLLRDQQHNKPFTRHKSYLKFGDGLFKFSLVLEDFWFEWKVLMASSPIWNLLTLDI